LATPSGTTPTTNGYLKTVDTQGNPLVPRVRGIRPTRNGQPPLGEDGTFDPADLTGELDGLFFPSSDGGPQVHRPKIIDLERMMMRDGQAKGLETVTTLPIRAATYRIEKGLNDKGEAEFVRSVLLASPQEGGIKTPISQVVAQMCGAFARRRAHFEKVWGKRKEDGATVIEKLAFRRASTCEIIVDAKTRSYAGFKQKGYLNGTPYEKAFGPQKAFVYIHGASSVNPLEGESTFEAAYQHYHNKQKLMLLYFKYLQKFGIPPVIGTTDSPVLADQQALKTKIEAIRGGSYAVLGPGETIGTLTAAETVGGSVGGSADFREAFKYLDAQMSISMLVQFLLLGTQSNTGSWALSRDHSDLFLLSEEARQREIEDAITNDVISDLVFYKFGPNASYPRFKFTALSQEHEAKAMDFLKALLSTGAAPPMEQAILRLVVEKAMANIDINQDAIEAAKKAIEESQKASGSNGSKNGPSDVREAIKGILGVPSPHALEEQEEQTDNPTIEMGWNPITQTRDLHGRFGPGRGNPSKDGHSTGGGVRSGGALGGGGQKQRSAFEWPAGSRAHGAMGSTRSRSGPGAHRPSGSHTTGDGVDKRSSNRINKVVLTKVALAEGEELTLQTKPFSPDAHYFFEGNRQGAAYAVYFPAAPQGRELEEADLASIYESVSPMFDEGTISILGRFEAGELELELIQKPPDEEFEPMKGLISHTYGTLLRRLTINGTEAPPDALIPESDREEVEEPTTAPAQETNKEGAAEEAPQKAQDQPTTTPQAHKKEAKQGEKPRTPPQGAPGSQGRSATRGERGRGRQP
jgi:hypothetical protein